MQRMFIEKCFLVNGGKCLTFLVMCEARAHDSVDDRGTMLQASFFSLPHPSCRTVGLEFTQPLTEMSTRRYF
jgi:hypothetical protein